MERLLQKNSTAKALAVILALVLWFYVITEQNPTISQSFRVPIQIRSLDPDLAVISVDPDTVTVVLEGRGQVIDSIDVDDLSAYISLADAEPGPTVASVRVNTPKAVQLVEVMPAQVISVVEPVVEARFPVELAVTGRVAPEYRADVPRLVPSQVLVRGGASLVARVERVVTNVDVSGARGTVQEDLAVYAIDASGRQVVDVQVVPREVKVSLQVEPLPPLAVLPIGVQTEGQPADGFKLINSVTVSPSYVVVRASSQALNEHARIMVGPVDIGDAAEPFEVSVPVVVPDDIELVGPETVTVYVPIGPVESEADGI